MGGPVVRHQAGDLTHRLLTWVLALALAGVVIGVGAGSAVADSCPEPLVWSDEANACVASASIGDNLNDPGDPGDGDSGTPVSTKPQKCIATGSQGSVEVPCVNAEGWWSPAWGCRVKKANPQPPKDDPVWSGNDEGAIYICALELSVVVHGQDGYQASYPRWSLFPPPGPASPVNPEEIARRAIAQLGIPLPAVKTAPKTDGVGLVGLPAWFWVEDTARQRGPLSTSATDQGLTVTLTAKMTQLKVATGDDGTTISCPGLGLAYADRYGLSRPEGSCTHRYTQPGSYDTRTTATWVIDWEGGGQSGEFVAPMRTSRTVTIGEQQVLNQ